MPVEVLIGTAIAVVLLFVRAIGPHEWRHPTRWRIPEIGPSLMVWFGANAVTAAVRLGLILIQGKVGIRGMQLRGEDVHIFDTLGADDGTVLLGGALAALLVGLATIREGMRGVIPSIQSASSPPKAQAEPAGDQAAEAGPKAKV